MDELNLSQHGRSLSRKCCDRRPLMDGFTTIIRSLRRDSCHHKPCITSCNQLVLFKTPYVLLIHTSLSLASILVRLMPNLYSLGLTSISASILGSGLNSKAQDPDAEYSCTTWNTQPRGQSIYAPSAQEIPNSSSQDYYFHS